MTPEPSANPRRGRKRAVRPTRYTDPACLQQAVDDYFAACDAEGRLYSDAGLCLALDVTPETLENWRTGAQQPELRWVIQRAFLRMAEQLHSHPDYQGRGMTSMAMFKLKQERFGGYQERGEAKDAVVHIKFGRGMDITDLQ